MEIGRNNDSAYLDDRACFRFLLPDRDPTAMCGANYYRRYRLALAGQLELSRDERTHYCCRRQSNTDALDAVCELDFESPGDIARRPNSGRRGNHRSEERRVGKEC